MESSLIVCGMRHVEQRERHDSEMNYIAYCLLPQLNRTLLLRKFALLYRHLE